MITPWDDYPVHQTAMPIATPASGDPNHYDRYFFNGLDPTGEFYFGVALGIYPNRRVIDAAFSIVREGIQHSVFASGRMPLERPSKIGPISIEVVQPLGVNRVRVDASHLGIVADLAWNPRTAAIEEPSQVLMDGPRTVMDVTRLVQFGSWSGSIDVEGARIDVRDTSRGLKDRSWGIRPVGEPVPGLNALVGGGVFYLWTVLHWADRCTHSMLFEFPDGHRWYTSGHSVPVLSPGDPLWGPDVPVQHTNNVEYDVDWEPGTRRTRSSRFTYVYGDGGIDEIALEPIMTFPLKGIGYLNPNWLHGYDRGEYAEGSDVWKVDELDPSDPTTFHVEQLVRARCGDEEGIGVLEQLVLGPHAPTGFTGYMDGARG
ncbi:MAG: hypothetical protein ACXVPP_11860 [Actinomycetota bacterium]